jgi:hypothetical protein
MDIFLLDINVIPIGSKYNIDGIEFESAAFIVPNQNTALGKIDALKDALIVPNELKNSLNGSGKYLIFTNASGIADDGGWTGVNVEYDGSLVHWGFFAEDKKINLTFDRDGYRSAIETVINKIDKLPNGIDLEPSQVFFPENW